MAEVNTNTIFVLDGKLFGSRSKAFREKMDGGVEWCYAVDYAAGSDEWFQSWVFKSIIQLEKTGGVKLIPYPEWIETKNVGVGTKLTQG